MLGKVLKDQDTLIEQSPWYEILQQNSHTDLNALDSAMNIINSQQILRKRGRGRGS